ncbi:nitrite reductase small subunit NirD [Streptomyces abyssomicinicus]|uniref:nitrite reductase small subunit NirD n=1 Tax=Streptomyces abyssomicinicus TaxID=574929 RepID=UPI001250059B|nr:nitrite reductase small subunit NirD [Streptomyces abyssomicinicus]
MTTAVATAAASTLVGTFVQLRAGEDWLPVCHLDRLVPGRGVAALLPGGHQVAVFLDRAGRLHAVDNRDPFTGAAVLSRGLLGSHQGRPFVASPLLKQRFDLATGQCLDDETVRLTTYEVRAA